MYVRYVTNVNWIATDIVDDIAKVLTGVTDINSYSSSCDKVNTQVLVNIEPAGWTLYDDVLDTAHTKVLTAPDNTGLMNKYFIISNSNGLNFKTAKAWNAATHTGTDVGYTLTAVCDGIVTTQSCIFNIIVTKTTIFITKYTGSAFTTQSLFCVELDRENRISTYYDPQYGKPNWFAVGCGTAISTSTSYASIPRYKSNISTGEYVSYSYANLGFMRLLGKNISNTRNIDESAPYDYCELYTSGVFYEKVLGLYSPLRLANAFSLLDEMVVGSTTYVIHCGIMIPKV